MSLKHYDHRKPHLSSAFELLEADFEMQEEYEYQHYYRFWHDDLEEDPYSHYYWYKTSESNDVDNDYKMHPIVINKKRFWSVDRAHYKTLNSFDEIKDDVQIWMTEINKKLLKARIEAI